jgi:hypothetical protein
MLTTLPPLHQPFRLFAAGIAMAIASAAPASAATYTVNSLDALRTQIGSAVPGDTIIVANGVYTSTASIPINKVATAAAPILIKAETIGGVEINGTAGFTFASPAAYVTVEGFKLTHSAAINLPNGTSHCRLTRNIIELAIAPGTDVSYVNIAGYDHQIDYNELRNKSTLGNMLDITGSGSQVARRLWVHHNYFHDFTSPGGNGAETIRWGLSGLSLSTGEGLCEYNLFVRCTGENEMISNKSSGNTYRYNTVLESPGAEISQRHGDNCLYYGNYMRNTAGIRVYGDSHQIFSNYLEGNTLGITMGNGDGDVHNGAPLTAHDRPDNNVVTFNTLINNGTHYQMGGRTNGLGAVNTTFANNIMQGGTTSVSISSTAPYTNPVWEGNIVWNVTNGGGTSMPAGTYTIVNPLLAADANGVHHLQAGSPAIDSAVGTYTAVTADMDGQPRSGAKDKGADEFSSAPVTAKILTPADVGPFAGGTVTPPPPVTPPIVFESEDLIYTPTGATASVANETTASGGAFASNFKYVSLGADGTPPPPDGEYIDFILPDVPAGTYNLKMRYKSHSSNRGILRLSVDGAPLGNTLNQRASATYRETDFGVVRFATTASHTIRLAVVGKDATASVYTITSDTFSLAPDKIPPAITVPSAITVPATSAAGAAVSFSATASDNKDGPVAVVLSPASGSTFPIGTSTVIATASDFAGNTATADFNVTVTPSYASWADENGLTPGNEAFTTDRDGDGLPNLLEYFLGSSPTSPDAAAFPAATVENNTFVFRFSRALNVNDVAYRVMTSNDLAIWTPSSSTPVLESSTATAEIYAVSLPLPPETRLFVRIEVTAESTALATAPVGSPGSAI